MIGAGQRGNSSVLNSTRERWLKTTVMMLVVQAQRQSKVNNVILRF